MANKVDWTQLARRKPFCDIRANKLFNDFEEFTNCEFAKVMVQKTLIN